MKKLTAILFLVFNLAYSQFPDDALRYSNLNLGLGARAIGLGFSYIGVSDDYSAVFWNPAGLAQIKRFEFAGGLNYLSLKNLSKVKVTGYSNSFENTNTSLGTVALVMPVPTIRGSLVFAGGYARVSDFTGTLSLLLFNSESSIVPSLYDPNPDFDLAWKLGLEDSTGATQILRNVQQKITLYESGGLNQWFVSGAIDIAENLSVGLTLAIVTGSYKYDRQFIESDVRNFYRDYPWDFKSLTVSDLIDASVSGFSANAGLMYRSRTFRFGLMTRLPMSLSVKENYSRSGESSFDNGDSFSYSYSGVSRYDVVSPFYFGAGVSFNLKDVVLIAGDVVYVDWRQMEFKNNPDLVQLNREIKQIFTETFTLSGGVEVTLPFFEQVKLRTGYSYRPSPYLEDKGITSRSVRSLSFGLSVLLQKTLLIDFAYVTGKWSTVHTQYSYNLGNSYYSLITDEENSARNFVLTLRYRF
jgi:long-subunit fatty acid transport protein